MIQTERLILRQWKESDFPLFAQLNSDPEVMEFFPSTLSEEESTAFALRIQAFIEENGWGLWAVSCPGVSDFIGFVGLWPVSFEAHFTPAVEIGWRLDKAYWGKGYATEAATKVLEFAFSQLQLEEVVSLTAKQNVRSMKVMDRIGMKRNPRDDFFHPKLEKGHRLANHVLYRMSNGNLSYRLQRET